MFWLQTQYIRFWINAPVVR